MGQRLKVSRPSPRLAPDGWGNRSASLNCARPRLKAGTALILFASPEGGKKLFKLDFGADLFKRRLDLFSLFFGSAFLQWLWRAFDKILGFL